MPGDFVNNDIDTMLNTDELATAAVWTDALTSTETDINGMYDAAYIDIDPVTGETVNIDPQIIVKLNDVTEIKQGDTITINTHIFNVRRPIPSYSDNLMTIILNEVV